MTLLEPHFFQHKHNLKWLAGWADRLLVSDASVSLGRVAGRQSSPRSSRPNLKVALTKVALTLSSPFPAVPLLCKQRRQRRVLHALDKYTAILVRSLAAFVLEVLAAELDLKD